MTLLDEIQAKCSAEMVAARDDFSITRTVNAGRSRPGPVSAATVRGLLYALGRWSGIARRANAARANADSSDVALACQTLHDLSVADQPIPMDNPAIAAAVTADLDLMVGAGLLTAGEKVMVLALGQQPAPVSIDEVSQTLNQAGKEG